jgi:hypothetical protein
MSCHTKEQLENMLEDVINELDLSQEMIDKHETIAITYNDGTKDTIVLNLKINHNYYVHYYIAGENGGNCLQYLIRSPYIGTVEGQTIACGVRKYKQLNN